MKIRIKEKCVLTLICPDLITKDMKFEAGAILEGEVEQDYEGCVWFRDNQGRIIPGLDKCLFEVVNDSTWPFKNEPEPQWYAEQSKRLGELAKHGFKFVNGNDSVDAAFIIAKDGMSAMFAVPKSWSFQKNRTWMLERCEEFARAVRGV